MSYSPIFRFVLASLLAGLGLAHSCQAQTSDSASSKMKPLFNGKDLSGWVLVNTPEETWKVENGMLICSGRPIGEIRTERMYQNFVMEVEWRHMVPGGNAGIFVWADDITARGVPFHRSVEVQVLENAYGQSQSHTTHGDIFPIHGAKMTPINGRGGDRAFPTQNLSKPSPGWNHYRITCQEGRISLAVNGTVVTQGEKASPSKGYICLESEGGTVHYRNLKILEMPDTPVDAADIATAHRGLQSLYSGLDLRGFRTNSETASAWSSHDWVLQYENEKSVIPLETEKTYRQFEWIMDIQFGGSGSKVMLAHGDSELELKPDVEGMTEGWNRIEAKVVAGNVTVNLNGQPLIEKQPVQDRTAPLRILPQGKVQFANLYAKSIE